MPIVTRTACPACPWQSVDGALTKAPLGGENTGNNPTDRGKMGIKRSVASDAAGVPTGVAVAGANVHDKHLLEETPENREQMAPAADQETEEQLCLDKGYDYPDMREFIEAVTDYIAHIRSRGEEKRELDRGFR